MTPTDEIENHRKRIEKIKNFWRLIAWRKRWKEHKQQQDEHENNAI